MDRRSAKTRLALVEAMVDLVKAKGFDDLRLGELFAAAGVGRSTFYDHYADKDAFLIASYVNLIDMCDKGEVARYGKALPCVLPCAPLLRHVQEFSDFAQQIARSAVFEAKMDAGERKLREIAARRIALLHPQIPASHRRRAAVFIAGAFIGMLKWWMKQGLVEPWEELDRSFKQLAALGLGNAEALPSVAAR